MNEQKKNVKPEAQAQSQEDKEFKHLVRVMSTDVKGHKQVLFALSKIKGVSIMLSNAVCRKAKVPINKKAGYLTDSEVKALENVFSNLSKMGIPAWMYNRRRDYETGEDKHLLLANLDFSREMDIKRKKKTKSYVGLRHQWGLPVRGQKTKSNFGSYFNGSRFKSS